MTEGTRTDNRPHVIAHRGASLQYPENTIEAFEAARQQGADGIELDIRWTADQTAVIFHDPVVKNGDRRRLVRNLNRQEFRSMTRHTGAAAPTLAEALHWGKARMPFVFDIKETRHELQLIRTVEEFDLPSETVFSSFRLSVVTTLKARRPEWRTAWIIGDVRWGSLRRSLLNTILSRARRWKIDALHFHHRWMTPDLVQTCKKHGLHVAVWTVDATDEIARMATAGVDSIMTNAPDIAIKTLSRLTADRHNKSSLPSYDW